MEDKEINPFDDIDESKEEDNKIFKKFKISDIVFLAIMAALMLLTGGIMPLALGLPIFGAIPLCIGFQFSIIPVIALMKVKKIGALTFMSLLLGGILAFMFWPMFICIASCGLITEILVLIIFRKYSDKACFFAGVIYTPLTIPFLYLILNTMYHNDNPKSAINAMLHPELWQVFVISGCIILVCALGSLLGIKISRELRKAGKFN